MKKLSPITSLFLLAFALIVATPSVDAQDVTAEEPRPLLIGNALNEGLQLGTISDFKGESESRIRGVGLVSGLSGTGDGGNFRITSNAFANYLKKSGVNINAEGIADLGNTTNLAFVEVQATLPAIGSLYSGDELDCQVIAHKAESLAGGRLVAAVFTSDDPTRADIPLALGSGPILLNDPANPATGVVKNGCMLKSDFSQSLVDPEGYVTILLKPQFVNPQMTFLVGEAIKALVDGVNPDKVEALNQRAIRVKVPDQYLKKNTNNFIAQLQECMIEPDNIHHARVVVNRRTGNIIANDQVTIRDLAVATRNNNLELRRINPFPEPGVPAAVEQMPSRFVPVDTETKFKSPQKAAKLKDLIDALRVLQVPNDDIIDLIEDMKATGNLYGEVIYQQ